VPHRHIEFLCGGETIHLNQEKGGPITVWRKPPRGTIRGQQRQRRRRARKTRTSKTVVRRTCGRRVGPMLPV